MPWSDTSLRAVAQRCVDRPGIDNVAVSRVIRETDRLATNQKVGMSKLSGRASYIEGLR